MISARDIRGRSRSGVRCARAYGCGGMDIRRGILKGLQSPYGSSDIAALSVGQCIRIDLPDISIDTDTP